MSLSIPTMLLNLQSYYAKSYTERQLVEIPKHLPRWADGTAHEMAFNALIQNTFLPNLGAIRQAYEAIRSAWEPTTRSGAPRQQQRHSDCIVCGGSGRTHIPVMATGQVSIACIYCDCEDGYAIRCDGKLQIGGQVARESLPGWEDFLQMRDDADWYNYSYDDYVWIDLQAARKAGKAIPYSELREVHRLDSSGRGVAARSQDFRPIEQDDVGF